MQYDIEKFANISMICTFPGGKLCHTLSLFHALSGCDTISYLYNVWNAFHEVELTEGRIDDFKEFVRTVMSAGKTTRRSYLETRIRMYQQRKENHPLRYNQGKN